MATGRSIAHWIMREGYPFPHDIRKHFPSLTQEQAQKIAINQSGYLGGPGVKGVEAYGKWIDRSVLRRK
jgi:hypothetical protein